MKKRLAALLALMALTLAALGAAPTPAQAAGLPTIDVSVDAENGNYEGYTIDDACIVLLETNVVYNLSGSTEKQVLAANAGDQDDQSFYLRLNGVTVGGGIAAQDGDTFRLCIDVPDGTSNNVEKLRALSLSIFGNGSLSAESLDVGPTSANASTTDESYLCVSDAQVEVRRDEDATSSCVWMGSAELRGSASVTYVSTGDYASLRVLNTDNCDEAVTLKDGARLYCLHANADKPSSTFVDGLQVVSGAIVLSDHAFLQAEARPWNGDIEGEGGVGILYDGKLEVSGGAQIVADAYGCAIDGGDVSVSGEGAYVRARSKGGRAMSVGALSVGAGARVDAAGKLEAVNAEGLVSIDNATLTAESEAADAIKTLGAISFENATVEVASGPGCAALSAAGGAAVNGSLLVVGSGDFDATIANSIVFSGGEGTVVGDVTLLDDLAIDSGETLTVPAGASLTIPEGSHLSIAEGGTLVNNGAVRVLGAIDNEGAIECNSHSGDEATCACGAVCDLCHEVYTDPDPANHANLAHVEARAATTAAEGSVEHWFCDACGKYYADAAAEREITQAGTVLARLPEPQKPADKRGPASNAKPMAKGLPQTGDDASPAPVAAALLGGVALAAAALVARRR